MIYAWKGASLKKWSSYDGRDGWKNRVMNTETSEAFGVG